MLEAWAHCTAIPRKRWGLSSSRYQYWTRNCTARSCSHLSLTNRRGTYGLKTSCFNGGRMFTPVFSCRNVCSCYYKRPGALLIKYLFPITAINHNLLSKLSTERELVCSANLLLKIQFYYQNYIYTWISGVSLEILRPQHLATVKAPAISVQIKFDFCDHALPVWPLHRSIIPGFLGGVPAIAATAGSDQHPASHRSYRPMQLSAHFSLWIPHIPIQPYLFTFFLYISIQYLF